MKRDREIQERMMSGKRKKYTMEERKILMKEQAERRNEYQKNNMGSFTKIFILSQEQFLNYKKYYDFAMEVYENLGKNESFPAYQKPNINPLIFYNNYFDSEVLSSHQGTKQKRPKDRESIKKPTQPSRQIKLNDSSSFQRTNKLSSTQQGSLYSSQTANRVTSAKTRNQKKERRVVYESRDSKKSLELERSKEKDN